LSSPRRLCASFSGGRSVARGAFWPGAGICGALIRGGAWLHRVAGQREPVDQVVGGPI